MKILELYNNDCASELFQWLKDQGDGIDAYTYRYTTPRNVLASLNYMDTDLDKGYVIAQQIVCDGDNETLTSSFDNLESKMRGVLRSKYVWHHAEVFVT